MNKNFIDIVRKLETTGSLCLAEYEEIILVFSQDTQAYLQQKAQAVRTRYYSNKVYIRGLIEISNHCARGCKYCGINRTNRETERYRLTREDVLHCCKVAWENGFRTFVLQGGEDPFFSDDILCPLIASIKERYPHSAVTVSLGERSKESYQAIKQVGADRYLLRHETADAAHYRMLHSPEMSFDDRLNHLRILKDLGFATGCGFMVGSPYQTPKTLAKDLKWIETFRPNMCGIGPFIPHHATEFKNMPRGDVNFTCYLLSLIRLIIPTALLPSTTALGSIDENGCQKGILAGANVIMPNISPKEVRKKYQIYDNKIIVGDETREGLEQLKNKMKQIGYEIVVDRGDEAVPSL